MLKGVFSTSVSAVAMVFTYRTAAALAFVMVVALTEPEATAAVAVIDIRFFFSIYCCHFQLGVLLHVAVIVLDPTTHCHYSCRYCVTRAVVFPVYALVQAKSMSLCVCVCLFLVAATASAKR